jgi:hypothetical protein
LHNKDKDGSFYIRHSLSGHLFNSLDINCLLMTNFTPEDLLSYLYKETSLQQTAEIEQALANSWTLREKLAVMKISMQRLDKLVLAPRTEVVLKVLNRAREKSAEQV